MQSGLWAFVGWAKLLTTDGLDTRDTLELLDVRAVFPLPAMEKIWAAVAMRRCACGTERGFSMIFEFADSEVSRCTCKDGRLQLHFSAARLRDANDPRADTVWAPVVLTAEHAEPWEALDTSACMGRLRQGFVLHASQRIQKLPLPCELQGVVTMELEFAQGGVVRVRCDGLSIHPLQGADKVGAYQC